VYGSVGPAEPAPPPIASPSAASNARYAYLVTRLRNRQITMEEATELFGILQDTLARTIARVPPMAPARASSRPPVSAPTSTTNLLVLTDETFALSLLALGVGSGLLSAILKRSAEGPKPPTAR
jgi:hypothetical protein